MSAPAYLDSRVLLRERPARPRPPEIGHDVPDVRFSLASLLRAQQSLTAVEQFSREHDAGTLPEGSNVYRHLLPATAPGPGQQYAFEVDLDVCSGCKACVAGCHSMNGLDETETWRAVGVLHGGTAAAPVQQTVTSACHHCVEPACMEGCPVKAYEKDPETGIVRHLDDQCIGCQYCTFMCPYDAPKYNEARGIVRKCDMCSGRLAHGEAPACVQACPNEAIRITVTDKAAVVSAAASNEFVPGAHRAADTCPTTVYKSARPAPANLLPADFEAVAPQHAHAPLVAMLVLTQLSVGVLGAGLLAAVLGAGGALFAQAFSQTFLQTFLKVSALVALGVAAAGMGAATLHLGRPLYAFRAVLGLRTSWLSREVLAFQAYVGAAAAYAATFFVPLLAPFRMATGVAAAASGLAGVFCSVMVYAATRRAHWRAALTGAKFFATTLVLGCAVAALVAVATGGSTGGAGNAAMSRAVLRALLAALAVGSAAKLALEASVLLRLRDAGPSSSKGMAMLLAGVLRGRAKARFVAGVAGGLVLPALAVAAASAGGPLEGVVVCAVMAALCLGGELLERHLFFAAAPASKMPGSAG